jgi:hypothetical protein
MTTQTTRARNFGGSIFASESHDTLEPLTFQGATLQVRPIVEAEFYILEFTAPGAPGPACLASHSNGHSVHQLAKRILAYWQAGAETCNTARQRAADQWEHILACGGMTKNRESLDYALNTFAAPLFIAFGRALYLHKGNTLSPGPQTHPTARAALDAWSREFPDSAPDLFQVVRDDEDQNTRVRIIRKVLGNPDFD